MIDQLHVQLYVRDDLPQRQCRAITRILNAPRFHEALQTAITKAVRHFPSLAGVRVQLTR